MGIMALIAGFSIAFATKMTLLGSMAFGIIVSLAIFTLITITRRK